MNATASHDAHVATCRKCGESIAIPNEWLAGGVRFARVVCRSCGETFTSEVSTASRVRYRGGLSVHDDFRMALAAWPPDAANTVRRAVLESFMESLRRTQHIWEREPSLLFPLLYPHLRSVLGEARTECRSLCDAYATRHDARGPWLRVCSDLDGRAFGALTFSADASVTGMCLLGSDGPLVACTADGRLLVMHLDNGRLDCIACGGRQLVTVGPARLSERPCVLAVAAGGQVFSFDPESREVREVAPVGALGNPVVAAVTADGTLVGAGSQWGEIVLWDTGRGARAARAMWRRTAITQLVFSGSAESLLAVYASGTATIGETRSLAQKTTIAPRDTRGVFVPAPPADAWWFFEAGGGVHRCAPSGRTMIVPPSLPDEGLSAAGVSFDGTMAVLGTRAGGVWVMPLAEGGDPREFRLSGAVSATMISADSQWLVAGDEAGRCKAWRLTTVSDSAGADVGHEATAVPGIMPHGIVAVGTSAGTCVRFSGSDDRDGTPLPGRFQFEGPATAALAASVYAAGGRGGWWKAWDVANLAELGAARSPGAIRSLALSPSADLICTGGSTGCVTAWDTASGAERGRYELDRVPIVGLAFAPDGERTFVVSERPSVSSWKLTARTPSESERRLLVSGDGAESGYLLPIEFGSVWERPLDFVPSTLGVRPDGQLLAVGAADRMQLLAAHDGSVRQELVSAHDTLSSVAFSPDGSLIVAAFDHGELELWDVEQERMLCRYVIGSAPLGAAWCLDARKFCVTDCDGRIWWFDVAARRPGHPWVAVQPNPSGRGLALACPREGCGCTWASSSHVGSLASCPRCGMTIRIVPPAIRLGRILPSRTGGARENTNE